jgi:hypothetical protein
MQDFDPRRQREFARVTVNLRARYHKLNPSRVEEVREKILRQPSVWATTVESTLRDMATSGSGGAEGALSRAILELSEQVVHLRSLVGEFGGPMNSVVISELSGGGGALIPDTAPEKGAILDIRIHDCEEAAPPIHFLAEVVHCKEDDPVRCGFKFTGIHPQDQDRLIRYIYKVQRKALRDAQDSEPA